MADQIKIFSLSRKGDVWRDGNITEETMENYDRDTNQYRRLRLLSSYTYTKRRHLTKIVLIDAASLAENYYGGFLSDNAISTKHAHVHYPYHETTTSRLFRQSYDNINQTKTVHTYSIDSTLLAIQNHTLQKRKTNRRKPYAATDTASPSHRAPTCPFVQILI